MPQATVVYVIDTCALVHIWNGPNGRSLVEGVVELARQGRVKTVDKVLDEAKRWPELHGLLRPIRSTILVAHLADPRIPAVVDKVLTECEDLIDQTGGRNPDPADPWLIAVAAVRTSQAEEWVVVTDENPRSPKEFPALCGGRCRCISAVELLQEVGLEVVGNADVARTF